MALAVKKTAAEIGLVDTRVVKMYNDQAKVVKAINEGSIISSEVSSYQELPLHWVMQMTSEEEGLVKLRWKATDLMEADPLTKVMRSGIQAKKLYKGMGMTDEEISEVVEKGKDEWGVFLNEAWERMWREERAAEDREKGDGEGNM